MRTIPSLFVKQYHKNNTFTLTRKVTPGLEHVLTDPNIMPTVQVDGECCAIINGKFYKRVKLKLSEVERFKAIMCQNEPDEATGKIPCWVPLERDNPKDRYFWEAYDLMLRELRESGAATYINLLKHGLYTFECCGRHFRGNPYSFDEDRLVPHGTIKCEDLGKVSFDSLDKYFETHSIEGIVFWKNGVPVAKAKRRDFGWPWVKGRNHD